MAGEASRSASRGSRVVIEGGVHLVLNEERFPVCGSWRSNWSRTADPARATCPQCVRCLETPGNDPPA
jgi:hypothetical protein